MRVNQGTVMKKKTPSPAPISRQSASVENPPAPAPAALGSKSSAASGKAQSKTPAAAMVGRNIAVKVLPDDDDAAFDALPLSEQTEIRAELRKRERIIRQDQKAWQVAPTALMEIRDLRLYRAEGFSDFGRYCRERIHLGKSTVNRRIPIGEVYKVVASTGATILPSSERQLRPLLRLRQPQQQPADWGKAVAQVWAKVVHDAEITKKPITEKSVTIARKELGFVPAPKDKPPKADLENCWARVEALLEHERELCPVEHLNELRVRIVGVISGWKDVKDCRSELDKNSAPKPIEIVVEKILSGRGFWDQLNWELRNLDLANAWHKKESTVRQMRYRYDHGSAVKCEPEEYQRKLAQEIVKAKAFGQSRPIMPAEVPVPKPKRGQAVATETTAASEVGVLSESEAKAAKMKAEHDAEDAEFEQREKAALAAEVPGSPMHKLMLAHEDARANLAKVKTRYDAAFEKDKRQAAAALVNPTPETKKEKKQRQQAWADEHSKRNEDYLAAEAAVDAAYHLVAAAKANQIAKKCKTGKNLPTCLVGEIVVQKNLSQYYGNDCSTVLAEYIQPGAGDEDLDDDMTSDGYSGPNLLTVVKPLPTKVDYLTLQKQRFTVPLPELIHQVYQLINDHRDDLQEKQDNASDAAQEGDAYQSRDELISQLENIDEPDMPDSVAEIMVYHAPKHGTLSEASRLLESCLQTLKAKGEAVVDADEIKEFTDSLEETLGVIESI